MFASLAAAVEAESTDGVDFQTAAPPPARKVSAVAAAKQAVADSLRTILPDPLAILQAKDEYVKSATATAAVAKQVAINFILQKKSADAAAASAAASAAVAAAAVKELKLQQEPPNLPSVRPGLANLRSKFHEAVKQGNSFESPDTLRLSLSLTGGPPATPVEAIKPQVGFNLHAQRTQEGMRTRTLKESAIGAQTGIQEAMAQPLLPQEVRGTDPLLQSLQPQRSPEQVFENYNFCSEMKKGTLSPSVPIRCIQEQFEAAGGKKTGLLYPAERSAAYYTFYSQPTYGDMLSLIESVAAKLHSQLRQEQAEARAALLGDSVGGPQSQGSYATPSQGSYTKPPQGAELFVRVGPQRIFVQRIIVKTGLKPLSAVHASPAATTGRSADYLLVASIWSEEPHQWHLAQKITTGMTAVFNKELWDFERRAADAPGDFRNLAAGKYIANATTEIAPLTPNFLRIVWADNDEDELLAEDASAAATKEPQSIPAHLVALTQDVRAPMLNFAVYSREREQPRQGVYAQPQFTPTFGFSQRFEEFRNPDIFYSLNAGVSIDTRPRGDLPEYKDGLAVFKSQSFWQCTTPISPRAWRTITLTVAFDTLPTAGKQPMRCVAAAYPFFLYLTYTPAVGATKQGVYLCLYRLKDNSYTFSRVPIEKTVLYFISISCTEGVPNRVELRVAPLAAARVSIDQLEGTKVALDVHDDVFRATSPIEGGSMQAAAQMPFISLGLQKYGLGIPGMNARVGYLHVFDYKLERADYEKEVRNDWQSSWFH
jgi:hypothetical protein